MDGIGPASASLPPVGLPAGGMPAEVAPAGPGPGRIAELTGQIAGDQALIGSAHHTMVQGQVTAAVNGMSAEGEAFLHMVVALLALHALLGGDDEDGDRNALAAMALLFVASQMGNGQGMAHAAGGLATSTTTAASYTATGAATMPMAQSGALLNVTA